jgi:hypothetical protein
MPRARAPTSIGYISEDILPPPPPQVFAQFCHFGCMRDHAAQLDDDGVSHVRHRGGGGEKRGCEDASRRGGRGRWHRASHPYYAHHTRAGGRRGRFVAGRGRRGGMSGPRLGFGLKGQMCGCSVCSGDLNTPVTARETGHFFKKNTPAAVHSLI